MGEKIWFLKRCDLFERLKPAELERLERHAVMRTFGRRDIIYFPADPAGSVLVLVRGRVKIKTLTPDGKEMILAFVDEGELFGELALLDDERRHEFAEAVETSQVLAIPRADFLWLMQQRPDVSLHITKLVGLRRKRIEQRLGNIVFRSGRERVVRVLLELLGTHGRRVRDGWEIGLRLSHQDLASLIGMTRESVTLMLGQLQQEGLIVLHRKQISILDRDRLAAEADALDFADGRPLSKPAVRARSPLKRSDEL